MIIGKVVSSVVSTRKYKEIQGLKLLMVQPLYNMKEEYFVATDMIGAGVGELVLVTLGEPALNGLEKKAPIDAIVVGIIDSEPIFEK